MNALPANRGTFEVLHAALLAADSATAVLEMFFGSVTARIRDEPPSTNEGLHERLCLVPGDILRHRAVLLLAGDTLLSEAELWYVANRLPADRVHRLENGVAPFGRIMQPLGLKRRVLAARICAPGEPASLVHRAVLSDPSGRPVAEVCEHYAWSLFPPS